MFFHSYFYLFWKFYLFSLSWKNLKDALEEDSPIVAPRHILFTYSESFMCLAWMVEKFEFWKIQLSDFRFWCLKINFVFS